jgi:polysaccharide deacetylase family protein (PEP-CTERM system associated)
MNSVESKNPAILITIDVEDWFQVENFKPWISFSSWDSYTLRVEVNTHKLLDLFDSINFKSTNSKKVKVTFFILGWLADRLPHLVKEIQSRGHEVASHGYSHKMCDCQPSVDLREDLIQSKNRLEDITGQPVFGFRAPSFSINDEILPMIEDSGYLYDSSYNSFENHDRYGHLNLNSYLEKGGVFQISDRFFELPISNLKVANRIVPWGGGGYFRMIPFRLFQAGVRRILKQDGLYCFYMHPWEIDPDQPRVKQASCYFKLRHYINIGGTFKKLSFFMSSFEECSFLTCRQYLEQSVPILNS